MITRARARRPGTRRGMEWTGAASNLATLAAGVIDPGYLVLPSQARAYVNPTLVRIRGNFVVAQVTASTSFGAIGIIAWSDVDDVLPVGGDIPAPFTRPDLDWIFHHYYHVSATAFGTQAATLQLPGHIFDSKAMRKLGANEGVLLVVQNSGLGTVQYGWGARALIKE